VPAFVLQPLVENAIVHGVGRSAEPVEVTLSARRAGDELVLEVCNGLPAAAAAPGAGAPAGGAGVGLHNTRARLEQLYGARGRLELEVQPGRRAVARVLVPFENSSPPRSYRRGVATGAGTMSDLLRVLVVDDEALARARLRRLLGRRGGRRGRGRGRLRDEARRLIAEERPDLVFLDVQMPGEDGFELLESLPAGAAPEVVFVTAYDQHALRAFEVNALDYLLKPFDRERLRLRSSARAKLSPGARRPRSTSSCG